MKGACLSVWLFGVAAATGAPSINDVGALKLRAMDGEVSAQLRLGLYFARDRNRNLAEAFQWYEMAAKTGEPVASHYLGKAYATGQGTPRNLELAAIWYRKAAVRGNAVAMAKLGELLSGEKSSDEVLPEAHAWFALAVENGETAWTAKRDLLAKQLTGDYLETASAKLNEFRDEILSADERRPTPPVLPRTHGEYQFPKGHRYVGGLKDGVPHGYGRLKTKDGDLFYGEFSKGTPKGYGTLFSPEGFILFTGLWDGGKAVAGNSPQARLRAKLNAP